MLIYEDNHFLVVNKPAGLLTQADRSGRPDLETQLRQQHRFLHAIFRLDRVASGLVLFARSSKALKRMGEVQRQRGLRKTYLAICSGKPAEEDVWEDLLVHDDFRARVDPAGKPSRLVLRRLCYREGHSLVEIDLQTGRYHQIRCQFGARGFPLVGDSKYGSPVALDLIALHHLRLEWTHPVTQQPLSLTALPGGTMAVLEGLFEQEAAHQAADKSQPHLQVGQSCFKKNHF
jgi:23S rRNA pseudouridine1911/1915/1917 synthase